MKFRPIQLDGVFIVEPEPRKDERGFLARTNCEREFDERGLNTRWVQQNHTRTQGRGSVRGLHWQSEPLPETKLVRCLVGSVLDVVVDVRTGSSTFGKWHAEVLSAENMRALYIPSGFAHGFQCLDDSCDLFYLMSEFYVPELACGLRCNDPVIGIPWALPVINLSARDSSLPTLSELQ
jgi:dTDP-4-dehydrorhamnose 3,5-epimerase